jgi:cyanoexosortase B-associated protein
MTLLKIKKQITIAQLVPILLLIVAIAIGAIPGYLSGTWSWSDLPQISHISQIKNLRKTGLTLPNWKTLEQQEVAIGGNKWSYQVIQKEGQEPVALLLMPQDYYKSHPQVEWTDIDGVERWKTDSQKTLKFSGEEGKDEQVIAQFFRAWNKTTFAVVQWYAWLGGGNYSPLQWFLADQQAQFHRRRVPWVAVSLKIPIEPLESLESTEALAQSLAQTVQTTLEQEIFRDR